MRDVWPRSASDTHGGACYASSPQHSLRVRRSGYRNKHLNPQPANQSPLQSTTDAASSLVLLPSDYPRKANADFSEANCQIDLAGPSTGDGASTVQSVAAVVALLHRYTDQASISLRVLWGRDDQELSARLTFPVSNDTSVGALADRAGELMRAHETQGVQEARPAAARSESEGHESIRLSVRRGASAKAGFSAPARVANPAPFDVHFELLYPEGQAPRLRLAYNARLFEADTIARLAGHFETLSRAAAAAPATEVANLPLLTSAEAALLAAGPPSSASPIRVDYPHVLFTQFARSQPDAIAVNHVDTQVSYAELNRKVNKLAHWLIQIGAGAERKVAVCLEPSPFVPMALLAIHKAGAVYVPLDPSHPAARIAAILEDTLPLVVLTQESIQNQVAFGDTRVVCLDLANPEMDGASDADPEIAIEPTRAACVFYTSGTTGKPKGVEVMYGNVAHYVGVARDRYGFGPHDTFSSVARFTFSISLFELLSPFAAGGQLLLIDRYDVLDPERLVQKLRRVSVTHAGPSLLRYLFRHLDASSVPVSFERMRHISSGGDMVGAEIMERLKQAFPNAEVFVIYGSTEVSCMGCTYPALRSQVETKTLVGKPFPHVRLRLVDAAGNLVPIGVVGEILFAGRGITRGYLNQPELTREKFVEIDGTRYYRTGDIGRLDRAGNIEFLGRRDFQIQLNGIRIELVEVEAALRSVPGVREGVTAVRETAQGDKVLVGYFVPANNDLAISNIRSRMLEVLPDYMVPTAFMRLEKLPLNINMKVDRNALPKDFGGGSQGDADQPRNNTERRIARVFANALGLSQVGIHDDFFSLGGHSLLAVQITNKLQDALGLQVHLGALFEYPTTAALAEHLSSAGSSIAKPIALNSRKEPPFLHMLMGIHIYRHLALRLENEYGVVGVFVNAEERLVDPNQPTPTIQEWARENIEVIQAHQPKGPYRIVGLSFGGVLAYEVAQQLKAKGEKVAFLCMIDAVLPRLGASLWLEPMARLVQMSRKELTTYVGDRIKARLKRRPNDSRETQFRPREYDDQALIKLDAARGDSYREACDRYMADIEPYDGPATLIVAGKRIASDPFLDPTCGWPRLVPQLEWHSLDAHHLELLEPPVVDEVATILQRALRTSGSRSGSKR